MDSVALSKFISLGENVCIEFKRGGNGFEDDAMQTVCSFSNRFGGDIFLGIADDGTVCGVPEKAAPDIIKNFVSRIGNPDIFAPTLYLLPEQGAARSFPSRSRDHTVPAIFLPVPCGHIPGRSHRELRLPPYWSGKRKRSSL